MNLKVKGINWVGNIYHKFESVCHEMDGIVGQDTAKYLENRVQNVGDSVKKLYSGVVHDLLPFPTLSSPTKYEAHPFSLKNNVGLSVMSAVGVEDNDKNNNRVQENPANNLIESLQDSNVIDLVNEQQVGNLPGKHELVNQVSGETCSDSLEVEDFFVTQEEVADDSREIFVLENEILHASIEETAIKSTSKLLNIMSLKEYEPVEFSMHSQSHSGSSDSACGVLGRTEVNVEQDSCFIVEEDNMSSSSAEVLDFTSVGETKLTKSYLFDESSDVDKGDTDILAYVSPAVSFASCKEPYITEIGTSYYESSVVSDGPYSESLESYPFEIESDKSNSGDVALCISDSSMAQVKESRDGIISSCRCQSMESNDESRSIKLKLEDIQLNYDTKREDGGIFVNDRELYAVSCRIQKLRSYKKRIQDAFSSKKRLAKEYEQLAIWFGDADIEPGQDLPPTLRRFNSRTYVNSTNLQVQQASETEWELL